MREPYERRENDDEEISDNPYSYSYDPYHGYTGICG